MKVIHTIQEFREYRRSASRGGVVPFVPTMGALHEGHASLVRQARAMAGAQAREPVGRVVASIFVNPTQFGPGEDFSRYPRTLEADVELLAAAGCDAVFVPAAQEMYPAISGAGDDPAAGVIGIDPGPMAELWEGAIRGGRGAGGAFWGGMHGGGEIAEYRGAHTSVAGAKRLPAAGDFAADVRRPEYAGGSGHLRDRARSGRPCDEQPQSLSVTRGAAGGRWRFMRRAGLGEGIVCRG